MLLVLLVFVTGVRPGTPAKVISDHRGLSLDIFNLRPKLSLKHIDIILPVMNRMTVA